jgi:hypothetical protein
MFKQIAYQSKQKNQEHFSSEFNQNCVVQSLFIVPGLHSSILRSEFLVNWLCFTPTSIMWRFVKRLCSFKFLSVDHLIITLQKITTLSISKCQIKWFYSWEWAGEVGWGLHSATAPLWTMFCGFHNIQWSVYRVDTRQLHASMVDNRVNILVDMNKVKRWL